MPHIPSRSFRSILRIGLWTVLALLSLPLALECHEALAEAPPLAVTLTDVTIFTSADVESDPVGFLPGGSTVELTGESAPGFIAIVADGTTGWVRADQLSVSGRSGIDTAVTVADTSLLAEPFPDSVEIKAIPSGESVMLIGATVGDYDAASRDGAGGWIDRHDILRKNRP